jgi:hypothetical protein
MRLLLQRNPMNFGRLEVFEFQVFSPKKNSMGHHPFLFPICKNIVAKNPVNSNETFESLEVFSVNFALKFPMWSQEGEKKKFNHFQE